MNIKVGRLRAYKRPQGSNGITGPADTAPAAFILTNKDQQYCDY